jgi:HTH-type transcriptional regulator/antitoxin HigA
MGLRALDPIEYGKLPAAELPRPIQNDRELERVAALVEVYDEGRGSLPELPPCEMVKHLMEQRGLKQADLVPVLGSRAQVSDLVNGKRGISKSQVKALAEYFGVAAGLFL